MKQPIRIALLLAALPGLVMALLLPGTAATQNRLPQLRDALGKTSAASTYRYQLTVSAAGLSDQTRTLVSDAGAKTSATDSLRLLTLAGEGSSQSATITYQNPLLSATLGIQPSQSTELFITPRTLFVRGPLPEAGAPRPVWYRVDRSILRGPVLTLQEESDLRKKLKTLSQGDLSWVRQARTETYESLNCAVYTSSDTTLVMGGLGKLGLAAQTGLIDGQVRSATLEFFVCSDGYLRQMQANLTAAPAERTRGPITMTISMILRDFDATITLNPPSGAIQLALPPATPTPEAPAGTPTPEPTAIAPTATAIPIPLEATVLVPCAIRATPLPRGEVVGQAEAEQTLPLVATTPNGRWYKVTAPDGTTGWVPTMFLRINPAAAARVPVER